nr:hypothetical protein [uncultured Dubosiella sp.]
MGNMKKLTGAALALTMLLGGTPIWAQTDDSSTTSDVDKSPTIADLKLNAPYGRTETIEDASGKGSVTILASGSISDKTYEELTKDDAMKNIIENAGFDVPKDANVVLLGAGDYGAIKHDTYKGMLTAGKGEKVDIPEGGMDFEFALSPEYQKLWKGLTAGDSIYVLHQLKTGAWEVIETTIEFEKSMENTDVLKFNVHLDSLSPIAFVKVMSDGTVVKLEKEEVEKPADSLAGSTKPTSAKKLVSVKKSPNTGF